jgi:hypothetical protein
LPETGLRELRVAPTGAAPARRQCVPRGLPPLGALELGLLASPLWRSALQWGRPGVSRLRGHMDAWQVRESAFARGERAA